MKKPAPTTPDARAPIANSDITGDNDYKRSRRSSENITAEPYRTQQKE